jgi:hypothetical protein
MSGAPGSVSSTRNAWLIGAGAVAAAVAAVAGLAVWTAPVRESVRAYTELIVAANRQDVDAAGRLCTARYLASHPLRLSAEGGLVGFPRNIPHQNFQAWRRGPDVLICPTNRVGPVYRFVHEAVGWRFDGPAGVLRGRGQFVPMPEGMPEEDEPADASESRELQQTEERRGEIDHDPAEPERAPGVVDPARIRSPTATDHEREPNRRDGKPGERQLA